MEDEDYFETDEVEEIAPSINFLGEEKQPSPIAGPVNSTKKIEPEISSKEKETVQKLHSKIAIKKFEDDEVAFAFGGNKNKNQPSPIAKLKIQFSINTAPEENDINQKRPGPDLEADEEIKDESKIQMEKKQKIE